MSICCAKKQKFDYTIVLAYIKQRWSRGHKARGQGQGHKKKNEAKAKDTSASALQNHKNFLGYLQKKKKKGLHKNFSSDLHKKTFSKKFFKRFTKF